MTLRIGLPDGTTRYMTQDEMSVYLLDAPPLLTRSQWEARAKEKARITINTSRDAIARMVSNRLDGDLVKGKLQTLSGQLLLLISSTNLAASTDEKSAHDILWAAYQALIVPFAASSSAAVRAEYKLEFDALTKVIT